jgi:hypothetical protein
VPSPDATPNLAAIAAQNSGAPFRYRVLSSTMIVAASPSTVIVPYTSLVAVAPTSTVKLEPSEAVSVPW